MKLRSKKRPRRKFHAWHPLEKFPPDSLRWPVFAVLLATSLWLGTNAGGGGLLYNTYTARYGIVSLEVAGTKERAEEIIAFWDSWGARREAIKSIYYDYAFLLFYSTTLALACILAAGRLAHRWPTLGRAGVIVAWTQWLAALCDAIENYALLKILWTNSAYWEGWPKVATTFASIKFSIIGLGLIYVLLPLPLWIIERLAWLREIIGRADSSMLEHKTGRRRR